MLTPTHMSTTTLMRAASRRAYAHAHGRKVASLLDSMDWMPDEASPFLSNSLALISNDSMDWMPDEASPVLSGED